MTTLVKRGTARRLGLRLPERQREGLGLFQARMPTQPYVPPVDVAPWGPGIYSPSSLGTVYIGKTRLG